MIFIGGTQHGKPVPDLLSNLNEIVMSSTPEFEGAVVRQETYIRQRWNNHYDGCAEDFFALSTLYLEALLRFIPKTNSGGTPNEPQNPKHCESKHSKPQAIPD
ncbi:MAG: hypothetical protein JWP52_1554 [Rhizobacter sp.]|nr:hypothetical protein [Rhizobacter sp.]